MREIKFRAFDTKVDQPMWDTEGCFSLLMLQHRVSIGVADDDKGMLERFKIMQYTGLKDMNGVEIYELHEIDNNYRVIYEGCSYVLQDISSGDIIGLLDNSMVGANEREITGEYAPLA